MAKRVPKEYTMGDLNVLAALLAGEPIAADTVHSVLTSLYNTSLRQILDVAKERAVTLREAAERNASFEQ